MNAPGSITTPRGREVFAAHLRSWLGTWPSATEALEVVATPQRDTAGWDGRIRPLLGVSSPVAGVVGVAPGLRDVVAEHLHGREPAAVDAAVRGALSRVAFPGRALGRGVLRAADVAPPVDELADAGTWVPADDPDLPHWLRPFNDTHVLVARDDDGAYGAGVGIKVHDEHGSEVAVVTEPALRGRGLGRRLVAQAMRRVVDRGQVVTYLHAPDNVASARVAEAVGLVDEGWSVWAVFPE